jgi:hypothetical protein
VSPCQRRYTNGLSAFNATVALVLFLPRGRYNVVTFDLSPIRRPFFHGC